MKHQLSAPTVLKLCTITFWMTNILGVFLSLTVLFQTLNYYYEGPWYQIGYLLGAVVMLTIVIGILHLIIYLARRSAVKEIE